MNAIKDWKRYKAQALLGIWCLAVVLATGSYVNAQGQSDEIRLNAGETVTEIPLDGVYSAGGLSDETFSEAMVEEASEAGETVLELDQWEASAAASGYQTAQDAIAATLDLCERIVEFPTDPTGPYTVSKTEVSSLVNRFLNSHPEYFYVDKISYVSLSNGYVKRLIFTYIDTPEAISVMRAAYYNKLAEAVHQVDTEKMSPSQICAVIHDYLMANCDYEYDKDNAMRYSAYGALVDGKAVCQGYALAYQEIINALGLDNLSCATISSESMDHAWNLVKIDSTYFHVDVTWDDTAAAPGQAIHNNLLLSDADIQKTGHTGYSLSSDIKQNSTSNEYRGHWWCNAYSMIYYHDGALYYLYPGDQSITEAPSSIANQSTNLYLKLVKKKLKVETSGTEGTTLSDQNVNVTEFLFATISVDDTSAGTGDNEDQEDTGASGGDIQDTSQEEEDGEGDIAESNQEAASVVETEDTVSLAVSEADDSQIVSRLTALYKNLKQYARLAHDGSYWYITTAYGIFRLDMSKVGQAEAAEQVTSEQVYTIPDTESNTAVYGMSGYAAIPVINGLVCRDQSLYYQTEGGTLTQVPDYNTAAPEAEALYVKEADTTITLSVNETYQLSPQILPSGAEQTFAYVTDPVDSNSVKVSKDGLISAAAKTTSPVTVKIISGDFTKTLQVVVQHIKVEGIYVSNATLTMEPGQTKQLTTSISPGNATCQDLTFAAVDGTTGNILTNDVVTVSDTGLVTAVSTGTAIVKIRLYDTELKDGKLTYYYKDSNGNAMESTSQNCYEVTCKVTVVIKPKTVTLNTHAMTLKPGETAALQASVAPANATDQTVTYASADPSVASVSQDGIVTAKAAGTTAVTVTTNTKDSNGTAVTDTCTVTVAADEPVTTTEETTTATEEPAAVTGVTLNNSTMTVYLTRTATLTASVLPDNAANKGIIWTSSDKKVATVKGVSGTTKAEVNGLKLGTATITATTVEGAYVASCKVTVKKQSVAKAVTTKLGKKVYTGKAIKPSITVKVDGRKLKKNTDYTITYKNNTKIGTATITIKGKGIYTGTKKITFTIVPRTPSVKVAAGEKSLLVSIRKVQGVDGYQIVYATDKTFTKGCHKVTVKSGDVLTRKLSGLKAKTTYYVKVRAYKIVSGKRVYSSYTKLEKKKTK